MALQWLEEARCIQATRQVCVRAADLEGLLSNEFTELIGRHYLGLPALQSSKPAAKESMSVVLAAVMTHLSTVIDSSWFYQFYRRVVYHSTVTSYTAEVVHYLR